MQADYVRMLREPRKAAYVAYVEAHEEVNGLLHRAYILLHRDPEITDPNLRAQRLDEAENAFNEAHDRAPAMDHLRAVIVVEGPADVAESAAIADAALHEYKSAVMQWLYATLRDAPDEALKLAAIEARSASRHAYTKLLTDASEAIGEGSVVRLAP
ncbi:hypothetical protein ABZ553_18145 [Streptomyces sparsogenes]|uniref:hypothetical protein n=1 Tax=Streptomyces sparsogenes TaxID=67365 RepID=UPI0033C3927F